MLSYSLLKNHAGVLLTGDYMTLEALREVVCDVNEQSPLIENEEGSFLGLAYDLRKAFEGKRQILVPPEEQAGIGVRYGVEILWPVLLWQFRLLRLSLGYIDSTKHMQAHTYALEAVIEDALLEDFGGDLGMELLDEFRRMDVAHPDSEEFLLTRGALYCAWTKKQRKGGILGLLLSFRPDYNLFYPLLVQRGDIELVSPEVYDNLVGAEWVDPKW